MSPDRPSLPPGAPDVPWCVLSLAQVDELQDHTHRLVLFQHVVAAILAGRTEDVLLEGLEALVTMSIEDIAALDAIVARGCQAVQGSAV